MSKPRFAFRQPRNLAVFVCEHVAKRGQPILEVAHDAEGDWQFLCGRDHGEDDQPVVMELEHVVRGDASLNELAELDVDHSALRGSPREPWRIVDDHEALIREHVAEFGWHVAIIPEDDEGDGFAYSIGFPDTLGEPEVIAFGVPPEAINALGDRLRAGERFAPGAPIDGLVPGVRCVLEPFPVEQYDEHLGYAIWFHDGHDFRVLALRPISASP